MKTCVFSCLLLISVYGFSQYPEYPQFGQLPSSPFPICGTGTFRQLVVPNGPALYINLPDCGQVETLYPFFYSINCYASGNLGLFIQALDSFQDFNWELFDITGRNPYDIYSDNSLQVIGNWSGTYGNTGAVTGGISSTACLSNSTANNPTFSEMPVLVQGHHYLLMVCSYSQIQGDYLISFPGTTAVIRDLRSPHMQSATMGCNKKTITVVMSKPMRCNSLPQDGSQFSVSSGTVRVTGAYATNCNDQFDYDSFEVQLSDTLTPGNYFLTAKSGTRDLSMFDDCFQPVPEGEQIPFSVFPSVAVSAEYSYQIGYGCKEDTIYFKYPYAQNGYTVSWIIDSAFASSLQEPVIRKPVYGPLAVQHVVSSGACMDSVTQIINLDNVFQAVFYAPHAVCPKDLVLFSDSSIGKIVSWNWNFGDGTSANQQHPPSHLFPDAGGEKKFLVTLTIKNDMGCYDTTTATVTKLQSCSIAVPNAFTPNGDGINDFLYPLNAFSANDLKFMVYNRYGQLVFETHDTVHKWDGKINGAAQPTGAYFWTLQYTDGLSGNKLFLHGTALLIR